MLVFGFVLVQSTQQPLHDTGASLSQLRFTNSFSLQSNATSSSHEETVEISTTTTLSTSEVTAVTSEATSFPLEKIDRTTEMLSLSEETEMEMLTFEATDTSTNATTVFEDKTFTLEELLFTSKYPVSTLTGTSSISADTSVASTIAESTSKETYQISTETEPTATQHDPEQLQFENMLALPSVECECENGAQCDTNGTCMCEAPWKGRICNESEYKVLVK